MQIDLGKDGCQIVFAYCTIVLSGRRMDDGMNEFRGSCLVYYYQG